MGGNCNTYNKGVISRIYKGPKINRKNIKYSKNKGKGHNRLFIEKEIKRLTIWLSS